MCLLLSHHVSLANTICAVKFSPDAHKHRIAFAERPWKRSFDDIEITTPRWRCSNFVLPAHPLTTNCCFPFPCSLQEIELQKQLSPKPTMIPVQKRFSPPASTGKQSSSLRGLAMLEIGIRTTHSRLACTHTNSLPTALLTSWSRIARLLFKQLVSQSFLCSTCFTTRFTSLCGFVQLALSCEKQMHGRTSSATHSKPPQSCRKTFLWSLTEIGLESLKKSVRLTKHVRS